MRHYLIAGGAGFIGTNLVKYLINLGHKVTVIDNFSTSSKYKKWPENVEFIYHDIIDKIKLERCFDGIFNLACPASPIQYQKDPINTLLTCILGTKNLLDIATEQNIPILQASTSEVYGDPIISPQSEEYRGNVSCIGVRACYDEGKRGAETLCFDYNRTKGTKVRVVRIFNTYGPYMSKDDGRVISNFINQCLSYDPITIYGDGKQTRSFCYVDDMIRGLFDMINGNDIGPINLGNPEEYSIRDIALKIKEKTKSQSVISFMSLPEDDPRYRCPDISKAKDILNWRPVIDLDEGLEKTIEYFLNISV